MDKILGLFGRIYLNTADGGAGGGGDPAGGGGAPAPWYANGVDAEHHEWLGTKQFANVNAALQSYRSLEGVLGRNRLAVPNGPEDTASYDAIYSALGRPNDAAGYTLKEGSTINAEEFKTHYAPALHKLGVSASQAQGLLDLVEQRESAIKAAKDAELAGQEAQQKTALSQKWGAQEQTNVDIASRAFRNLGLTEEQTDGIESVLGYQATMELFHKIGAGMSEGSFHQDSRAGGGNPNDNTVEAVQKQINEKMADPEFKARYRHDNPTVRQKAIAELEPLQIKLGELMEAADKAAFEKPFDPKNPLAGRRR